MEASALAVLQDLARESAAATGATDGGLQLAGLDLVGLGIVAVLFVLGIARGLWWQLMRLAGIVAAVVLARTFGGQAAAWIAERWPEIEPRLAHGAAWIAVFLAGMAVAMLIGLLGHRLLEAMQLGLANRMGGGLLGAATGVVVHVALIMGLCQLAPQRFVEQKIAGTYSERLYLATGARWKGLLPPVAAAEVERLLVNAPPRPGEPAAAAAELVPSTAEPAATTPTVR